MGLVKKKLYYESSEKPSWLNIWSIFIMTLALGWIWGSFPYIDKLTTGALHTGFIMMWAIAFCYCVLEIVDNFEWERFKSLKKVE